MEDLRKAKERQGELLSDVDRSKCQMIDLQQLLKSLQVKDTALQGTLEKRN